MSRPMAHSLSRLDQERSRHHTSAGGASERVETIEPGRPTCATSAGSRGALARPRPEERGGSAPCVDARVRHVGNAREARVDARMAHIERALEAHVRDEAFDAWLAWKTAVFRPKKGRPGSRRAPHARHASRRTSNADIYESVDP